MSDNQLTRVGREALAMTRRGYFVMPLCFPANGKCACGGGHIDKAIGKAPFPGFGDQSIRLTEEEVTKFWLAHPSANYGVLVEPSGLLVVDADSPEAVIECEDYGVPPGPRVKRGDHCHRFFKGIGPAKSAMKWGKTKTIDLKVTGYIVGPGCLHRSGDFYELAFPWDDVPPEEPPRWAVEAVKAASLNGTSSNGNHAAVTVGPFTIDPSAKPPFELFDALLDNNPHFRLAWGHKLKLSDPSASAYDMALADAAAEADWTDQQIVNLMIAHRRKWGEPVNKGESYFTATIDKARRFALKRKMNLLTNENADATADDTRDNHGEEGSQEASNRPVGDGDNPGTHPRTVEEIDKERQKYLTSSPQEQALFQLKGAFRTFRLPLSSVRKVGRRGGQFELLLEDGRIILLGDAEAVLSLKKSAAAIADAVQVNILLSPKIKERWLPVTQAIFTVAAEGVDIGSDKGTEMLSWLYAFTQGSSAGGPKTATGGPKTATDNTGPSMAAQLARVVQTQLSASFYTGQAHSGFFWTMAAELVIHVPSLVRFVTSGAYGQRVGHGDARERLYALGFHREHLQARTEEGKQVQARVFVSPKGFVPEE